MAHIAVERNRRRQMNEHLKVLRSLTPCFYIKRGDQASIIGGVIEFIKELHQVMESLESNKRRKSLSPSPSPRTVMPPTMPPPPQQLISSPVPSPTDHRTSSFSSGSGALVMHDHENSSNHSCSAGKALFGAASCNSPIADVEAKMSGGSNVVVRTISRRIPGQIVKIIAALEKLSFEVLHINISSMEDTVLYSFVLKIGLECPVSVEELAHEVQQSFGSDYAATADQLINV